MADTLLEQFLVHECTPQVRHLLTNAIDDTSMLQPFFEFNRFEVTIDRDYQVAVLTDVLDATEAGVQRVPLAEFTKALMSQKPRPQGEFRNLESPTLGQFEQILSEGDPNALTEALIGIALGNDDFISAFRAVTTPKVTGHTDPGVRGAAVLSLGHLVFCV